jgi:HTH-type transcriptional regulator / antitoxin HigA
MTTYEKLLCETHPEVIETDGQYDAVSARLSELIKNKSRRTDDETRLMRLLALLVEDYDRRHALPPLESTPEERLAYLLETSGKTPADLLSIFDEPNHVNEILSGTRPINAEQARKLAQFFCVNPGLFL